MKIAVLHLLMIAAATANPLVAAAAPNVIFIMADDQGSVDAGCYGSPDLKTPALDALAAKGVRFEQFYAAAPICSASRAGALTGRYPWRTGVPTNASGPPDEETQSLADVEGRQDLRSDEVTLAEALAAAGYVTGHVGKWHLGSAPGSKPLDQGFGDSLGFMGGCIDNYSHFNLWGGPNRHDLWRNNARTRRPGEYFPDLVVAECRRFLSEHRSRPFFLYVAFNMPHYPYQGSPEQLERYKTTPYPRALYGAFLSTLDDKLGEILAALDEFQLAGDTIVVYQSDNGYSTEERAHFGGGGSGPFRGAKFSLFEGGIRVPAVIAWPGRLPVGVTRNQVAHACDWLPTLTSFCGAPTPDYDLDGRDLSDVLTSNAPSPHNRLVWRMSAQSAIRVGDWKLLHRPETHVPGDELAATDRAWFLVNLANDVGEQTNLAAAHPEKLRKLQLDLSELADNADASDSR